MAQPGWVLAQAIKRSRAVFFEIQRIGAGNPMLGPFPVDPGSLERLSNGLVADLLVRPALLDTQEGGQVEGPEARLETKIARGTMQETLPRIDIDIAKRRAQSMGAMGIGTQSTSSLLIEGMDGIAYGLFVATQSPGYPGRSLSTR